MSGTQQIGLYQQPPKGEGPDALPDFGSRRLHGRQEAHRAATCPA